METQSKVNFNVEFFYGENETLLLNTTLNDIQLEEVDRFRKILNDYLDSACFNSPDTVRVISLEGCDEALLYLRSGRQIEVCAETTFKDMLNLITGEGE